VQGSSSLPLEVNNSSTRFSYYSQHQNAAEYEALICGLNIAISLGVKRLMVYGDSLVVIRQINKGWDL
jgi:ribonuclease HI